MEIIGKKKREKESAFMRESKGSIASTLAEARASLVTPSRPFTPSGEERHLFIHDYPSRPNTSYSMTSTTFMETLRPPTATRLIPISISRSDSSSLASSSSSSLSSSSSSATTTNPSSSQKTTRRTKVPLVGEISAPTPPSSPRLDESDGNNDYEDFQQQEQQQREKKDDVAPPSNWREIKDLTLLMEPENSEEVLLQGTSQLITELMELGGNNGEQLSPSKRKRILQKMFRLVDSHNVALLLRICRIIEMLTTDPEHILNLCKLLYKLSKNNKNDTLFRDEQTLGVYQHLSCSIFGDIEFCTKSRYDNKFSIKGRIFTLGFQIKVLLYTVGTLKNVTNTEKNQKLVASNQKIYECFMNFVTSACENTDEKLVPLLVQVTATLRNISVCKSSRVYMTEFIPLLCNTISKYQNHLELMNNIARILSKITVTDENRKAVSLCGTSLPSLLSLLRLYPDNMALVVRVCFILGNLTVNSDENRLNMCKNCNALDILVPLFAKYNNVDIQNQEDEKNGTVQQPNIVQETEQVLVKLIRVLANLAINPELGPIISTTDGIQILYNILERKSIEKSEELVLNVVGAITNLSFYYNVEGNLIVKYQVKIAKLLVPLLLFQNEEAIAESVRAYGNFSRDEKVLALMAEKRLDTMMVLLLNHSNQEVVFNVCGVLMNLVAYPHNKKFLLQENGIEKLMEVLFQSGVNDLNISLIVCKVLYNLTVGGLETTFTTTQIDKICSFLDEQLELLDTDNFVLSYHNYNENTTNNNIDHVELRETFKQVATQLLNDLLTSAENRNNRTDNRTNSHGNDEEKYEPL